MIKIDTGRPCSRQARRKKAKAQASPHSDMRSNIISQGLILKLNACHDILQMCLIDHRYTILRPLITFVYQRSADPMIYLCRFVNRLSGDPYKPA